MFAIKDLESIKNLASIMVIPFLSAAWIADAGPYRIAGPLMVWLENFNYPALKLVGLAVAIFATVVLATILLAAFDYCVVWLHVELDLVYLMPAVGFSAITAGLFVLSFLTPELPKSSLNPFWHFGLLCYGFSLFSRAQK